MHSIRTRFIILAVSAVILSTLSIGLLSLLSVRGAVTRSSAEEMLLISETQQQTLNTYLYSVEQTVDTMSRFSSDELHRYGTTLAEHLEVVERLCRSVATNTTGALTYYYRISPDVSVKNVGFRYRVTDSGDVELLTPTDLTQDYSDDPEAVIWYTVPKALGVSTWLEPYYSAALDLEIISYVSPVHWFGLFIGVTGMDLDIDTLVDHIRNTTIYETGYSFLTTSTGEIVYHPTLEPGISVTSLNEALDPTVAGSGTTLISYDCDGVEKRAACSQLENGMMLYVCAPQSEIDAGWTRLLFFILAVGILILTAFAILSSVIANRLTKPLRRLTEAALELDNNNYDVQLDYDRDDEVGILTRAFRQLTDHLKVYIGDLNNRAYVDAMTSVRNKGAFDAQARRINDSIAAGGNVPPFAMCMFDCNNLKRINDVYGHEKGDIYLKTACGLICRVFRHSAVFRLGGDEFAAILMGEDFHHRNSLLARFDEASAAISAGTENEWERVSTARGIAVYDPALDEKAEDVLRRADEQMYEYKKHVKRDAV